MTGLLAVISLVSAPWGSFMGEKPGGACGGAMCQGHPGVAAGDLQGHASGSRQGLAGPDVHLPKQTVVTPEMHVRVCHGWLAQHG